MSCLGRFLIAGFCFVWAILFALFAPQLGEQADRMYIAAGGCALVGMACIQGPWQRPLLRLIAAGVFAISCLYVWDEVHWLRVGSSEPDKHHSDRISSLVAMVMFGLPGGYFAFFNRVRKGRFDFHGVPITEEGIGVRKEEG